MRRHIAAAVMTGMVWVAGMQAAHGQVLQPPTTPTSTRRPPGTSAANFGGATAPAVGSPAPAAAPATSAPTLPAAQAATAPARTGLYSAHEFAIGLLAFVLGSVVVFATRRPAGLHYRAT